MSTSRSSNSVRRRAARGSPSRPRRRGGSRAARRGQPTRATSAAASQLEVVRDTAVGSSEAGGRGDHRRVVGAELAGDELQRAAPRARRAPRRARAAARSRRPRRRARPPPSSRAGCAAARVAASRPAGRRPPPGSWRRGRRGARERPSVAELADRVEQRRLQAAEAEVEAAGRGVIATGNVERLRVAARAPRARSPARPGSRGRAAAPPCRAPRRRRRRASGRAPRSASWLGAPPASSVWPPLAIRQRNGGSSGSGSRKLAATWPCRWSTPASGLPARGRQRLRGADADQQRADQARPAGDRERVDVARARSRPRRARRRRPG